MENLSGKQLGPYQVISLLGEGGMAAVYKAYQPSVDRYVALKILPQQFAKDSSFMARFEQEARIIASLEHPYILPVYDYGTSDGYTYIVMRYVEGGTLADWMDSGSIPLDQTVELFSQIASALDYAHARGVVHRDLKPNNVMLDEQKHCLLTDFGIAKLLESTVKMTTTGGFLGTPAYASPEQAVGDKLDGRSDVYSLGVMLYELLTGGLPFEADMPVAILVKHVNNPLPLPSTINPAISPALEAVLLKALAKQPGDRYQSAGELAGAFAQAANGVKSTPVLVTDKISPDDTFFRDESIPAGQLASVKPVSTPIRRPLTPSSPDATNLPQTAPKSRFHATPVIWVLAGIALLCLLASMAGGGYYGVQYLISLAKSTPTHFKPTESSKPASSLVPTLVPVTPEVDPTIFIAQLTSDASQPPTPLPTKALFTPVVTPLVTEIPVPPATLSSTATSNLPVTPPTGSHPAIVVTSYASTVHLVWADKSSGTWDIYYTRSDDLGQTFGKPVLVDAYAPSQGRLHPTMTVDDQGYIYIAWQDFRNGNWDIYFSHSKDGVNFSMPVLVNEGGLPTDQVWPSLTSGARKIFLAWQDGRNGNDWDVYYVRSVDGGLTFSPNQLLSHSTTGNQMTPTVDAVSSGQAWAAWADDSSGKWEIHHAMWVDEAFVPDQVVGTGLMENLSNELPDLSLYYSGPFITWANAYIVHPDYGVPLYLPVIASFDANGNTLTDPHQVGDGFRYVSVRPSETGVFAYGSSVYVALTTYSPRDGSWVWYYHSDDTGKTFSTGVGVKQVQGGDVLHFPSIAVGMDNILHVTWGHQRGDEWDVYYARSTDRGTSFIGELKLVGTNP